VVVLASVVLVIRQRIREIGIMKAIGASNGQIGFQFGLETTVITVVATVLEYSYRFFSDSKLRIYLPAAAVRYETVTGAGGLARGGTAVFGGGGGRIFAGSIGGIHVAISPRSSDNSLCISHHTGNRGQRDSGVVHCPGQTGGGITQ